MTQAPPSVLLLIPAYNEENRIEPVLREYAEYFPKNYPGKFQLTVVLNGCRDNTIGVVRRMEEKYPDIINHIEFAAPIGKGGALIEGLKLAPLADLIGYVDADGATGPKAFHDLVKLQDQADCVIGSRWLPGAILHQSQSGQRRFASRVFHSVVEACFGMHIRDTQCGAKLIHRKAVEKIHSSLQIADMAFDINLLVALKRAGFKVLEVPTEWTDKIGSKVMIGKTSLTMLLSVIRLRIFYWPTLYKLLRPLSPIEGWLYKTLSAPRPRSTSRPQAAEKLADVKK